MNKRAAIYVRVSTERQDAEDKVSIDMQIADCEEHCQKRGYIVVAQFVDNKKYRSKGRLVEPSATRSDRPGYKKLLKAAHDGEFDYIIAWKEDRLCRGIYSAVPLGRVLEETPVKIELVKETFDVNMFFIKAAIGKIELDNIKERMHMGVQGRLKKGKVWDPYKRYGYAISEDGMLEIDEERAGWVRQIYEWYLQGVATREIRRRLIEAAAPQNDRTSGPKERKVPWPMSNLQHILTSPEYCQGYIEAKRGGKMYQITCPPIISREIFDRVQALRKEKQSHADDLVKYDYLCLGLVTCADQMRWGARTIKYRGNGVVRKTPLGRYFCPGKDRHKDIYDSPDCPKSIGSKKLDDYVWGQVMMILKDPGKMREGLYDEIERLKESEADLEKELDRLQSALDDLAMERQWVITQARKRNITEQDMELQLGALSFQELALRKEQGEMATLAEYRQRVEDLAKFAEDYLADLRDSLTWIEQDVSKLDEDERREVFEERRAVVKMLVQQIIMHKEWPPEIVFGFEGAAPLDVVSSVSNVSLPTGR